MKENWKVRKVSKEFADELDRIKRERIKLDMDMRMISDSRLTEGMIKFPEWETLREKLKRAERRK